MHKSKWLLIGLVTVILSMAVAVSAQDEMIEQVHVTTTHVESHPSQGDVRTIDEASASLMSSEAGISVHLTTNELEAGHVYTMWIVMVSNPKACSAHPCPSSEFLGQAELVQAETTWGDGILVSDDTRTEFSAFLPVGEVPEGWYGIPLSNPTEAEVYLVINDHGELIPEMAATMLNTYRGGCTDESIPASFPDTARADGEPGPNTCRLIQVARFIQGSDMS